MSLILNIDTALEVATVCLAKNGEVIQTAVNPEPKDHAAWVHPAIKGLLQQCGYSLQQLDAVAVSIGPGSYTGLRVGLSSAKGLCYALDIPLISIGTLEMIAFAVKEEATDLICPLVDARRMEVFAAVYDKYLTEIIPPHATLLEPGSFGSLLGTHKILFCGNGSKKLQSFLSHANALFAGTPETAHSLSQLSHKSFVQKGFADLAYTEPLYVKDFYSPVRKE